MHYELIKRQVNEDFDDIEILGWIEKNLPCLKDTHLGLDLNDAKKDTLQKLSKEVLKHIDLEKLQKISVYTKKKK